MHLVLLRLWVGPLDIDEGPHHTATTPCVRSAKETRPDVLTTRRPIADILIGAFAARHEGLVTRNPDHFRPFFPQLVLAEPPPRTP